MAYVLEVSSRPDRPGEPRPAIARDVALNDSNKDLDVTALFGANRYVQVVGGRVEFSATSTVGSRILRLEQIDAAGAVVHGIDLLGDAEFVIADGDVFLELTPRVAQQIVVNGEILVPIENLFIQAGQKLRIRDSAAIDAAADDLIVSLRLLVW